MYIIGVRWILARALRGRRVVLVPGALVGCGTRDVLCFEQAQRLLRCLGGCQRRTGHRRNSVDAQLAVWRAPPPWSWLAVEANPVRSGGLCSRSAGNDEGAASGEMREATGQVLT